jgi:SAM-dependent methyltransferase
MRTVRLQFGYRDGETPAVDSRPSFLDVGSGIGSKLFLAEQAGLQPAGLELRTAYVEVSRRIWPQYPVTCADALAYEDYGDFDVIYCYRIAQGPDLQDRVNRRIIEQMRPGALFFSAGGPNPDWLEQVGDNVWRR